MRETDRFSCPSSASERTLAVETRLAPMATIAEVEKLMRLVLHPKAYSPGVVLDFNPDIRW
jgi:hypothetical protein